MKAIPVRHIVSELVEQNNTGRFSIRDIRQLLNGKDLVHTHHKRDFFFVLAVKTGKGMHEIDFIKYPVHDCCIFILKPGQVHQLQLSADSSGFLMEFDLSFYQPKSTLTEYRWRKASNKNYCEIEVARFLKLHSILENIFSEFITKNEGYVEAIKANMDLFFIEYIRQSHNPANIAKTESGYRQERFEELLALLEADIGGMKNVSEYADLLNLSSYQLNAITKASVGKTVSEMINEQIVLEAKRYLLGTSHQIKDVADHLGYEDVSYFIRFFKKHTGLSPDAFRKNFK